MAFGLSLPFGLSAPKATNAPSEAQMSTVRNQGGGVDAARNRAMKQNEAGRVAAARISSNQKSSFALPQQAAKAGRKKGA